MTKKIGDKKIGGIESTKETNRVRETESVGNVGAVKPTGTVGGVKRTGGVGGGRSTRTMSAAERAQLMKMIGEEAEKLVAEGAIPASQKKVVSSAVKMAIDSSAVEDEEK